MRTFILVFGTLIAQTALASGGGGDHEAIEIPTKLITYQTINVVLMSLGLIYFLRDGVKKFFMEKREAFLSSAKKAEEARRSAEQSHQEIHIKLTKLQSTADESVARARAEAADLKKQLVSEAQALSERIRLEAEASAKFEIERAKRALQETLIKESFALAKGALETKVSADDQSRLQAEFFNNIQVVQK